MSIENYEAMRASISSAASYASRVQLPPHTDVDDAYVRCATERDRLVSFLSYLQASVGRFDPDIASMIDRVLSPGVAEHKRPA